jgi:hypothetical protein
MALQLEQVLQHRDPIRQRHDGNANSAGNRLFLGLDRIQGYLKEKGRVLGRDSAGPVESFSESKSGGALGFELYRQTAVNIV